jgi:serine/threonine-protein kinase
MWNPEGDNRYRVLRRLASGGMSDVVLAHDTVLDRYVALKRVRTANDAAALKRLRREATLGAAIDHPNLVRIFDVWENHAGDMVIVMEYVAGDTLQHVIRSRGRTGPSKALPILAGVAAALDTVHARGIVHRDVKPANILLGIDGTTKLADLGVAAVDDHTKITTSGQVIGTFSYMPLEQLEGKPPRPASDIYALAAVAFEALSGKKARPEPNPVALAHAIATRPPPDLRDQWPEAPAEAAQILKRAMSSDPAQRPGTAGQLVERLRQVLEPVAKREKLLREAPPSVAEPASHAENDPRREAAGVAGPAEAAAAASAVGAASAGPVSHVGIPAPAAAAVPPREPQHRNAVTARSGREKPRAAQPDERPAWRRHAPLVALVSLVALALAGIGVGTFAFGGTTSRSSSTAAGAGRALARAPNGSQSHHPRAKESSGVATGSFTAPKPAAPRAGGTPSLSAPAANARVAPLSSISPAASRRSMRPRLATTTRPRGSSRTRACATSSMALRVSKLR